MKKALACLLLLLIAFSEVQTIRSGSISKTKRNKVELDDLAVMFYLTEYVHPTKQLRMVFTFQLLNVDIADWEADGLHGMWFGLGMSHIPGHDGHKDFMMCEFIYTDDENAEEVMCYDRFWDNEEFYIDDTN